MERFIVTPVNTAGRQKYADPARGRFPGEPAPLSPRASAPGQPGQLEVPGKWLEGPRAGSGWAELPFQRADIFHEKGRQSHFNN